MSTHAYIALEKNDGSFIVSYLHHDGYPLHAGNVLLNNYPTRDLVENLIRMGDIDALRQTIGKKHDKSTEFDKAKENGWTTFEKRDLDNDDVSGFRAKDFRELMDESLDGPSHYLYIYDLNGNWRVANVGSKAKFQTREWGVAALPTISLDFVLKDNESLYTKEYLPKANERARAAFGHLKVDRTCPFCKQDKGQLVEVRFYDAWTKNPAREHSGIPLSSGGNLNQRLICGDEGCYLAAMKHRKEEIEREEK